MDRQRLLMIFGAAWLSAALLTWFLYARTTAPKTEKMVKVVAAARDLAAGEKIEKDKLKMISMAEKDAARGAVLSPAEVIGRTLIYPVSAGEPVSLSRVTSASGAAAGRVNGPGRRSRNRIPDDDGSGQRRDTRRPPPWARREPQTPRRAGFHRAQAGE